MNSSNIRVGGSVSGSIIGGSNNSLRIDSGVSDAEQDLERLLGVLRANLARRPEDEPGRTEMFEDLDGLQEDLTTGADRSAVNRRLSALQSWGEMLGLVSTMTAIAQTVKQLLP
jgi:hypothetical protein